jgi:esterase/lipase superfamily enzyme
MRVSYHSEYSRHLARTMEYKVYGHGGRPIVVFPTSNGRFYQYEDSGMIAELRRFIDAGKVQVWTIDGIDGETFFSTDGTKPIFAISATKFFPKSQMSAARRTGERKFGPC